MATANVPNDDVPILDPWTALSFKRAMGNRKVGGRSWVQPTWVGEDHQRRLQAYDILEALASNAGRYYLASLSDDERDEHREYGDAGVIVEAFLDALLGDEQHIVTDGAADFDPDAEAPEPDPDAPPVDPETEPAPTPDDQAAARSAWEFQTWAEDWADTERLPLKLIETEGNAVRLGDGLYTLGWSDEKGRPRLRVFNPGFYFPVLHDGNEDDFPERVHVAWEVAGDDADGKRRVHRITWQLVNLADLDASEETRDYPWNDEPSRVTCLMSEGIWTFDASGKQTIDDFTEADASWLTTTVDGEEIPIHDLDLRIDFIPVIHVPNSAGSIADHYGKSSLLLVAQILDDLANADTDLQAASATTGKPPIGLSGSNLKRDNNNNPIAPTYKAGQVWELGENGKLDILDTANSLDALIKYVLHLLDRLSVNSRIPAALLGRIAPGDVNSGLQLLLSFAPFKSVVQKMRLVRSEKHPLIIKFAHRLALAGDMKGVPAAWIPTTIELGKFLPEDATAIATEAVSLYNAKVISLETAVRMLIESGFPIDDLVVEIDRIQGRDYEGAQALLAALGSRELVADYLGVELPEPPPAPAPRTPAPGLQPPLPAPGPPAPQPTA